MLRNGLLAFAKLNFLMDLCPRGHSVSQSPCPLMESQYDCCHAAKDHKLKHFLCTYGFLFMHRIPAFLPRCGVYDPLLPSPSSSLLQSAARSRCGDHNPCTVLHGKELGNQTLASSLTSCETLGQGPSLSELHFLICKMKKINFFKCTQKRLVG